MSYVGRYVPKHREKYLGIGQIPIYKSMLELLTFRWLDENNNVKRWGYELIRVPYFLPRPPFDGKVHRYMVDIYAEIINTKGGIEKYLAEVKSTSEFKKPSMTKSTNRNTRRNYNLAMVTFIKNQCKWKAAKQFCDHSGMKFIFITEQDLY